ncbi:MAG: large conductance mechanosensitive channel protein MscL [Bacilli bacterium]|nr:large conductance mechanosensitive channel protein MscL [Bacilli bacterium]
MKDIKNVKNKVKDAAKNSKEKINKVGVIGEFKEFISHGNVLDLAVGVIIGGAFQSLVTSLTNNLISPILGCLTEADFTAYSLKIGNLNLKYGAFLTDIINFLIMAFVVFLIVKFMNRLIKKEEEQAEAEEPKESDEVVLLKEIRDLLKNNK